METVMQGVVAGVLATICLDLWAVIVRHVLRLPTANWAMVGRWFAYMPRGVFVHRSIHDADPVAHELATGWVAHYAVGIGYGLLYLAIVKVLPGGQPTLASALAFALATLAAPWLVMQPAMGAGVFASRTPRPGVTRLVNLSMHLIFGASLYLSLALIGAA